MDIMRDYILISFPMEIGTALRALPAGKRSRWVAEAIRFRIEKHEKIVQTEMILQRPMVQCQNCNVMFSILRLAHCPHCGGMKVILLPADNPAHRGDI
jgi:Zn finger protein HypA/HybF involved in hydrogenase expression